MLKRKVCGSCGLFAIPVSCDAYKMVRFDKVKGHATVYHNGNHTCMLKLDRGRNDGFIQEKIKKHPSLTPRKLKLHCIKQKIDEGV